MQTNEKPAKIMFGNPQHSTDQYQIPLLYIMQLYYKVHKYKILTEGYKI